MYSIKMQYIHAIDTVLTKGFVGAAFIFMDLSPFNPMQQNRKSIRLIKIVVKALGEQT